MPLAILAEHELDHINRTRGRCCACEHGELISGPVDRCGQQFRCRRCGQEFHLEFNAFGPPVIWTGRRIRSRRRYTGGPFSQFDCWTIADRRTSKRQERQRLAVEN